MKILFFSILMIICTFAAATEIITDTKESVCQDAAENELGDLLYTTGLISSVLSQSLSGNVEEANKTLGSELALKVIFLHSYIEKNPCNLNKKTIDRVYPILRVVAAFNQRFPMDEINKNKDVTKILDEAIANDPKHYHSLLERSLNWNHGIK